jgi:diguanylate cyclase (GGDEF)-like protein
MQTTFGTGQASRENTDLAFTDTLTGLGNHRRFFDKVDRLISDRADDPAPFTVGILDLDGFKPINDQFGHVVGDKVLKAVAAAVARSVRISDVAARYGGDEFAVILPQTPAEGSMRVCERILRTISELEVRSEEGIACNITASLGLAYYPADDIETPEELIHSADGALYGAKRTGRNRFTTVRPALPLATA